jgi:hypothetical protein
VSAGVLAFIVALSSSVWVFTKLQNKTGYGNNSNAIKGAAVVFIIAFIVVFTLAHSLLK